MNEKEYILIKLNSPIKESVFLNCPSEDAFSRLTLVYSVFVFSFIDHEFLKIASHWQDEDRAHSDWRETGASKRARSSSMPATRRIPNNVRWSTRLSAMQLRSGAQPRIARVVASQFVLYVDLTVRLINLYAIIVGLMLSHRPENVMSSIILSILMKRVELPWYITIFLISYFSNDMSSWQQTGESHKHFQVTLHSRFIRSYMFLLDGSH